MWIQTARPWGLKIIIRGTVVHVRKSKVRANKLDVQETDISFTQFNRSWNYLSWCRFTHGWNTSSWSLGFVYWSVSFFTEPNQSKKNKDHIRGDSSRNTTSNKHTQNQTKVLIRHDNLELSNVDSVSSIAKSSQFGAMFYIFEDNEAVIKVIIKGRSPTMRHASRTHRVALDWLFGRIHLDPKIQIKCVDTKHQLADMLTSENFTRDEWNNLLHLFNSSDFSIICCSQNYSLIRRTETMAKRMQEQKEGDNRILAKSTPTTINLAFSVSTSSSTVNSPIASKSPGILKAPCRTDWYRETWRKRSQSRHSVEFSRMAKRCICGRKYRETCCTRISRNSGTEGNDEDWPHNLHISTNYVLHMEKVFSIVRQRYGHCPRETEWKTSMWTQLHGVYSCPSLFKLQFILGQTLRRICVLPGISPRNHWDSCFKWLGSSSLSKRKLVVLLRSFGSSSCGERRPCWLTSLFRFATAKTNVFSDSVLCLRGISPEPVKAWVSKIKWFMESRFFQRIGSNRRGTDGIRVEKFPRIHYIRNSRRDSKDDDLVKEGSSSCQCTMTLIGEDEETKKIVLRMLSELLSMLEASMRGHWSFLGPGSDKKLYGTHVCKPDGQWDEVAENMMINFAESEHLFPCIQRLRKRRIEKAKGKECNPFTSTVNSYFRQLSQCQRSNSGSVWRISQGLKRYCEARSAWWSGIYGFSDRISDS